MDAVSLLYHAVILAADAVIDKSAAVQVLAAVEKRKSRIMISLVPISRPLFLFIY